MSTQLYEARPIIQCSLLSKLSLHHNNDQENKVTKVPDTLITVHCKLVDTEITIDTTTTPVVPASTIIDMIDPTTRIIDLDSPLFSSTTTSDTISSSNSDTKYSNHTVNQLKDICRKNGLRVGGTKLELLNRISSTTTV